MFEYFNFYNITGCFNRYWLLLFLLLPLTISAQDTESEDKTYSPRFYIPDSTLDLDALPLKSTTADVKISGVIADVTITQTYTNEGSKAIEAKYVFPASTRAALYYLHMQIGQRLLVAQIKEKEEASEIYEQAVDSGYTATLLEQQTPNVFQMSVGNILPGDTIQIEMKYTELLIPEEAVYEFVFPTVVGPRYTGGKGEEWTQGPYQHEGEDPLYYFDIDVEINAGMPLSDVTCLSHPLMEIKYITTDKAIIDVVPFTEIKGNKDFILQYRLSGDEIQTGLLAYEGEDENFFLAMIQPPKKVEISDIPPREYIFIMDVSGSMSGFPISVSKAMMTELLNDLRLEDKFNIMFFAGGSYTYSSSSVKATRENIDAAVAAVDEQRGGGSTQLLPALEKALKMNGTGEYSRTFIILTDGYVTVEREAFDLIKNNLGEANFFSFGIGSSVNRYIIEGIAHVGQAEPFVITKQDEAEEKADQFRKYIESPVLTNISVDYDAISVYEVEPVNVPDIFAERPVILYGKYKGPLRGSISVSGITGGLNYYNDLDLSAYKPSDNNKSIMYLWARKRIQLLDDYANLQWEHDEELINEIIDLGLQYNLMSEYTSFVVVDSVIRCDTCSATTVNQPLPLPEGVSDYALGQAVGFYGTAAENSSIVRGKNNDLSDKIRIEKIYPNPVTESFTVSLVIPEFASEMSKSIEIYDVQGRLVSEFDFSSCTSGIHLLHLSLEKDLDIDVTGTYFLVVRVNELIRSSEIINVISPGL